jgi:hypothetical protein
LMPWASASRLERAVPPTLCRRLHRRVIHQPPAPMVQALLRPPRAQEHHDAEPDQRRRDDASEG